MSTAGHGETGELDWSFQQLVYRLVSAHEKEVQSLEREIDNLKIGHGSCLVRPSGAVLIGQAGAGPVPTLVGQPRLLTGQVSPPLGDRHPRELTEDGSLQEDDEMPQTASEQYAPFAEFQDEADLHKLRNGHGMFFRGASDDQGPARMLGNIKLDTRDLSLGEWLVRGPFEVVMSILIIINTATLFMEFQCAGLELGIALGTVRSSDTWEGSADFFFVVGHIFQVLYMVELLFRMAFFRTDFFYDRQVRRCDGFNVFDLIIVLVGCLDLYILPMVGVGSSKLSFFRVVRLARLSRTFKVVRVLKSFAKVRVLIGTVAGSFLALCWSMMFLFVLMFIAACFVSQQLQSSLPGSTANPATQKELWARYGTATRAFWTMFEVTLGGQGTYPTKQLVELHWTFTLFFLIYISGVVFAVICIIQALFLKDTLEVAALDAEAMVQEASWRRNDTARKLEQLFLAADTSGDGCLSMEEFEDVLAIPEVMSYLQLLELEPAEAQALFEILDDGDELIEYNEFVQGVMRLKGQARSMDVIAMQSDLKRVLGRLGSIEERLGICKRSTFRPGRSAPVNLAYAAGNRVSAV